MKTLSNLFRVLIFSCLSLGFMIRQGYASGCNTTNSNFITAAIAGNNCPGATSGSGGYTSNDSRTSGSGGSMEVSVWDDPTNAASWFNWNDITGACSGCFQIPVLNFGYAVRFPVVS